MFQNFYKSDYINAGILPQSYDSGKGFSELRGQKFDGLKMMGGRFGKYGDLKRKAALRRSRRIRGPLQKGNAFKPRYKHKKWKRN